MQQGRIEIQRQRRLEKPVKIQKTVLVKRVNPVMILPTSPINVREKRIREVEAPILEAYGFEPTGNDLSRWRGKIKGVDMTVVYPELFPAVPFQIHMANPPPGFYNLIRADQVCIERLIDEGLWDPTISTEQIFLNVENHRAFKGRG